MILPPAARTIPADQALFLVFFPGMINGKPLAAGNITMQLVEMYICNPRCTALVFLALLV
ncbi:MAG: hypothetical protein A2284_11965 [Deltaproteobacteria bacterium RIFOXYA12_FULL_61_11]|nr:MAG: hypothetical protein A2284_11965 [Deltaproteobacteria bacterium RIFOXYA12_FULL_61_11]